MYVIWKKWEKNKENSWVQLHTNKATVSEVLNELKVLLPKFKKTPVHQQRSIGAF